MSARLILICHGATAASRAGAFPRDEPLDAKGAAQAGAVAKPPRAEFAWTSPALRARQTAEALGLTAKTEAELRDCDHGRWAGRSLKEIGAEEPEGIAAWIRDPAFAGHGGESIDALLSRVASWLAGRAQGDERAVAVTHAAVMRAAVVAVLGAPAHAFWRIDIAPLARVTLSAGHGQWRLRAIEPSPP